MKIKEKKWKFRRKVTPYVRPHRAPPFTTLKDND